MGKRMRNNHHFAKVSDKEIEQITNDIIEGMCAASRSKIMGVTMYWIMQHFYVKEELESIKRELGLAQLLKEMKDFGKLTPQQMRSDLLKNELHYSLKKKFDKKGKK